MAVKRSSGNRNLDMAIRRMGSGGADYLRMWTLHAKVIIAQPMLDGTVKKGYTLKAGFAVDASKGVNLIGICSFDLSCKFEDVRRQSDTVAEESSLYAG